MKLKPIENPDLEESQRLEEPVTERNLDDEENKVEPYNMQAFQSIKDQNDQQDLKSKSPDPPDSNKNNNSQAPGKINPS